MPRLIASLLPHISCLLSILILFSTAHAADATQPVMLWGDSLDEGIPDPAPHRWAKEVDLSRITKVAAPPHLRWALLRCAYPGSPAHPLTAAQTRRAFEKPEAGLFAFFGRQSRGALTQEVGWVADVVLPRSLSAYWTQYTNIPAFLEATTADCLAGATQVHSLDGITAVAVLYNNIIDCCAYGSPYSMPLPGGGTRQVPAVWLPPLAQAQPIVIAHEIVHGLGVGHSNNSDQDNTTTDNWWDLMSSITRNLRSDAEIGPLPRGFHAYHRRLLGWLDDDDVLAVAVNEGPDRTEEAVIGTDGLLHLNFTPTTGLTVTYRGANTNDEGERAEPAVFIDELNTMRPERLWVVDDALPLPTLANTNTSYFTSGESWVVEDAVPGRAVMVDIVSVSASEATVRVHLGPPPPPVEVFSHGFELTQPLSANR